MSLIGSKNEEKTYLIAYFDILGTKEKSKRDIDSVVSNLELINHFLSKEALNHENIKIKTFSDNFLICIEDSGDNKNLEILLETVSLIAYQSFNECGSLIRGAITKGKMIINNYFVVGEALIRSYKIEEEVAVYPRIIIDKVLINSVNVSLSKRSLKEWIYLDFDMEYCLNFLKAFSGKEEEAFRRGLKARLVELLLKMEGKTDLKVKAKYNYVINYLNSYYLDNYGYELLGLSLFK